MPVVEIYSKTSCSYCWQAKRLLDSKGVEYKEISLDYGGPERDVMIQRAKGRTTVPQIFIDDRHIGGCSDLMALERTGQLDSLIAA